MRAVVSLALVSALALGLAACGRDRKEAPADSPGDTAAATAPGASPGDSGAAGIPRRKPGLWEMTMSIEGEDMAPMVTRVCLDEATESRMAIWGGQVTNDMCSQNRVNRKLDGSVEFSSVCDMGSGGRTTSTGTATGDLTSNYVVKVQSTTTGATVPQMNRSSNMTIASRRVGACEAGQKGGDMIMPGGVTINMNDMPRPAGR